MPYHFTGVFLTKTTEISKFHFRATMVQGGNCSHFYVDFYWTYERGLMIIYITIYHGLWPIILMYSFPTKTMEILEIHFGHSVGKYGPGAEFPRNFCVRIGPLQVGVVPLFLIFNKIFECRWKGWNGEVIIERDKYIKGFISIITSGQRRRKVRRAGKART